MKWRGRDLAGATAVRIGTRLLREQLQEPPLRACVVCNSSDIVWGAYAEMSWTDFRCKSCQPGGQSKRSSAAHLVKSAGTINCCQRC